MIIENAFWKLPELLTNNYAHGDTFEATVVHLLAVAMLMELDSRNIERPYTCVETEKPYPLVEREGKAVRADLFVDLERVIPNSRLTYYGTRDYNWIEAKAYLSSVRQGSRPPKTANVGKVLRDLLRICLLPKELQGPIRQNARYFLMISSRPPSQSLAFQRGNEKRIWLSQLLEEGYNEIQFDMREEPETFRRSVGVGFVESPNVQIVIRSRTMAFKPEGDPPTPVFWGYLTRICYFRVVVPDAEIEFEDKPGDNWNVNRIKRWQIVQDYVLERL